jgi:ubiquinone/menaquinone biosynthesis C-methylase UbiE
MKQTWPAALRNAEPIARELRKLLPMPSTVVEIASGTGQHAAHFCKAMPEVSWQPTEHDASALESIAEWQRESGAANFKAPKQLDVREQSWPVESADAVFCANMIHIAPWECCEGLMRGCGRILTSGGALLLYGPFLIAGVPTAPSNTAFDESLRARNPQWGIRQLERIEAAALAEGLELAERIEMPANNFIVHFRRR